MGSQVIPHELFGLTQEQILTPSDDTQLVRQVNDPIFDMGRGLYTDKITTHRDGINGAVPNGSWADIWSHGPTDPTYNWPITDETFRIAAGGDINDTATGTGARSIRIIYLDSAGNRQEEVLATAGVAASAATSLTGRRIIHAQVVDSGTYGGNNIGTILIENTTSGQIVGAMQPGVGQIQLSQFTVDAGFTGFLDCVSIVIATGANKDADVRLWARPSAYVTTAPFGAPYLVRQWLGIQEQISLSFTFRPQFPALTDIWFEANGNGAVTAVTVDYDMICIRD
jgi:hypothetical protein